FATKADMNEILEQLRQTTETAESIKSTISVDEWSHKEYRMIRRVKLEELLTEINKLMEWLDKRKNWKVFGGKEYDEVSPIGAIELLITLYFPELEYERRLLKTSYYKYTTWLINADSKILDAKIKGDNDALVAAVQEANATFTDVYNDQLDTHSALKTKA